MFCVAVLCCGLWGGWRRQDLVVTVTELPMPLWPGSGLQAHSLFTGCESKSRERQSRLWSSQKLSPMVSRLLDLGNFVGLFPVILGESRVALAAGVCLPCEWGVQLQSGPTTGW